MPCDRRLFRDSWRQISNWIQQFAICSNLFVVPEAWASTPQPPLVQRDRKKWNFPRFVHCKCPVQFAARSFCTAQTLYKNLRENGCARTHTNAHKQQKQALTHNPGSSCILFTATHKLIFSSALSLLQSVLLYDVRGQEMQSVRTVIQTRSGFPG